MTSLDGQYIFSSSWHRNSMLDNSLGGANANKINRSKVTCCQYLCIPMWQGNDETKPHFYIGYSLVTHKSDWYKWVSGWGHIPTVFNKHKRQSFITLNIVSRATNFPWSEIGMTCGILCHHNADRFGHAFLCYCSRGIGADHVIWLVNS